MPTDDLPDGIESAENHARKVLAQISAAGLTVATAESCTGGLLASLLTDIEGCSSAFDRGFVTYSAASKTEMLGVQANVIAMFGVVSREVALAMAQGALENSN